MVLQQQIREQQLIYQQQEMRQPSSASKNNLNASMSSSNLSNFHLKQF